MIHFYQLWLAKLAFSQFDRYVAMLNYDSTIWSDLQYSESTKNLEQKLYSFSKGLFWSVLVRILGVVRWESQIDSDARRDYGVVSGVICGAAYSLTSRWSTLFPQQDCHLPHDQLILQALLTSYPLSFYLNFSLLQPTLFLRLNFDLFWKCRSLLLLQLSQLLSFPTTHLH